MSGVLDREQVESLLNVQTIGRIACYGNGKNYVLPVKFVYDGLFIYCCAKTGNEINIMRRNPRICFEADEQVSAVNWKSVIINGKYEEMIGEEEKRAYHLLRQKLMPVPVVNGFPDEDIEIEESHRNCNVFFRIRIDDKKGMFEKQ